MSFILGIDTGGTYTDGVIVQSEDKRILRKSKALTTKEDLRLGIQNCIENLAFSELKKVNMVCLSTTLATNAIVEGRGCKVGLILIGGLPDGKLPLDEYSVIRGRNNIQGQMVECCDEEEIYKVLASFKGRVEALAISGYASVRNPELEVKVKKMAQNILEIPTVCAHELTSTLGFYERTVTVVLNARLIPLIKDLMVSVKTVLHAKEIKADLMIVKGDGSLMSESVAVEKPIETILSGPAASIAGGLFLAGQTENALILDMGGTTTDIAIVKNGHVKTSNEGACVGGWMTRVCALDITTCGIGGDSRIKVNEQAQLEIGPERVWPLCVAGKLFPELIQDLKNCQRGNNFDSNYVQDADCLMLFKKPKGMQLGIQDEKILDLLQNGPHSLYYIADRLGEVPETWELNELLNCNLISCVSVTPTDILHVQGRYRRWDKEIAELGVQLIAERLEISSEEFLWRVNQQMTENLVYACSKCMSDEKGSLSGKVPIIAIGAPVSAWMQDVAAAINTDLIIPEHAEVANAVGAAVGQVKEAVEALIRFDSVKQEFVVYTPWERKLFKNIRDAKMYALLEVKKRASQAAANAGSDNAEVFDTLEDVFVDGSIGSEQVYMETHIRAIAIGTPDFIRR